MYEFMETRRLHTCILIKRINYWYTFTLYKYLIFVWDDNLRIQLIFCRICKCYAAYVKCFEQLLTFDWTKRAIELFDTIRWRFFRVCMYQGYTCSFVKPQNIAETPLISPNRSFTAVSAVFSLPNGCTNPFRFSHLADASKKGYMRSPTVGERMGLFWTHLRP